MRPEPPARYQRSLFETPLIARHLGNAGAHGGAQHRAPSVPLGRLDRRRRLRRGHSRRRLRFHRRHGRPDYRRSSPWPSGRTSPCRSSSRARRAPRHALARLPGVVAVEPQRSCPRASARGTVTATSRSPGYSPDARLRRIVDREGRTWASRPRASCSRGCSPTCSASAPATPSRSRSWKDAGPFATASHWTGRRRAWAVGVHGHRRAPPDAARRRRAFGRRAADRYGTRRRSCRTA